MTVPHDEDAVRAAYDQVAGDYADAFPATEPEQAIELAMIEHFVSLLQGHRQQVLDAGCGAGRKRPFLHGLGCQVMGTDLSPEMVRRAHCDHSQHTVHVATSAALPFRDDSFDGVFFWYSTIHTPDDRLAAVLSEAQRVPGGTASCWSRSRSAVAPETSAGPTDRWATTSSCSGISEPRRRSPWFGACEGGARTAPGRLC